MGDRIALEHRSSRRPSGQIDERFGEGATECHRSDGFEAVMDHRPKSRGATILFGGEALDGVASGRVEPIVLRSRITKTIRIPAENATPKTGYQVKKKSGMDANRGI
jgi:hypothetical protein